MFLNYEIRLGSSVYKPTRRQWVGLGSFKTRLGGFKTRLECFKTRLERFKTRLESFKTRLGGSKLGLRVSKPGLIVSKPGLRVSKPGFNIMLYKMNLEDVLHHALAYAQLLEDFLKFDLQLSVLEWQPAQTILLKSAPSKL